jgi:hypothetical protein
MMGIPIWVVPANKALFQVVPKHNSYYPQITTSTGVGL